MRYIISLAIIITLLLCAAGVMASDVSDADFEATITTTNNGTANVSISSNISGLRTPYLISAGFLNSSANNCAMQAISGADIPFMPGNGTNPWMIYNGDLGSDTVTMSKVYFKNITDGKICMFLDDSMIINDSPSIELSDNYSIKLQNIRLIDHSDNVVVAKGSACYLGYDYFGSGNLTWYSPGTGNILSHALELGEHDIEIRAIPSGGTSEYILRPEAEGDLTEIYWTTGTYHYTEVDDIVPDDHTTRVTGSASSNPAAWKRDLYEVNTVTFSSCDNLTVHARCRTATSYCKIKIIIKTGGIIYEGSEVVIYPTGYNNYSYSWPINPNTSLAWTQSDINDLQIGISIYDYYSPVTSASCTQVYAAVNAEVEPRGCEMIVDGLTLATSADDFTISDTVNDYEIGSGCVAYIGEFAISVDGIDKCIINWEYGATFTDDSGNGNDATPTLRTTTSDPDVISVLSAFGATTEYIAPAFTVTGSDWFSDNITATANFTTGNATLSFPGKDVIDSIATAGSTPSQLIYTIISMFILVAMGLLTGYFLREQASSSMILTFVAVLVVMAVFVALKWWDWWMMLFWLIIVVATGHAGQHRREA